MSPRLIVVCTQDDLEEMREVPAVRFAHFNRIHVQITRAARAARRRSVVAA